MRGQVFIFPYRRQNNRQEKKQMRIIFYNGTIYTGEMPLQEAFVVENNKFLYAGNWETAKSMATEDAEWVDLEGKFVLRILVIIVKSSQ